MLINKKLKGFIYLYFELDLISFILISHLFSITKLNFLVP